MSKIVLAFLNFFYPKTCLACAKDIAFDSARNVCDVCFSGIRLIEGVICQVCGLPLPDGGATCHLCKKHKRHFDITRSATIFEGPMRQMIHAFKYQQQEGLALELSFWLAHQWLQTPELQQADYITAVPLHTRNLRQRGYNQSQLLAQHFLDRLARSGKPLPLFKPRLLRRIKHTQSQMTLDRQQRQDNIANAFAIDLTENLQGKTILVLDDVCTTGFTLDSCAQTLRLAGAKKVMGFSLARD